jgi:hypothetical protein
MTFYDDIDCLGSIERSVVDQFKLKMPLTPQNRFYSFAVSVSLFLWQNIIFI